MDGLDPAVQHPGQPPDLTAPPHGLPVRRPVPVRAGHLPPGGAAAEGDSPDHEYRCFFPVGQVSGEAAWPTCTSPSGSPRRTWRASLNGGGYLLKADHLVKNFAVTSGAVLQRKVGEVSAVADVSFGICPGKTFGMVGESGCGKTTIGRLIVGLEKATSGSIVLDGEDLLKLSDRERRTRSARSS